MALFNSNRDLTVRIDGDASGFERAAKSAEKSAAAFERELGKLEAQQRKREQAMTGLGQAALGLGAATLAGVALTVRAAAQWESAWAGVAKTVDGSATQMGRLEDQLRGLARELPASHREIAAVAEAAGQLGVRREDIAGFTKVMIDLGETTNLTADEAATALAQLMNVMGTAPQDVGRLGAALVELGNNGASTEQDIVQMALRIAGAGNQIGLTEAEVLGFASALSSVGIEAEAGGSAISRVMIDIATAVETGGESLDQFAAVAGMTTAEFSRLFRDDAAAAINAFVDGLGRMQASGQSTFGVLEDLNLSEIRVRDTLLRLSGAQGLATESIRVGNEAWEANQALVDEANKRYETTEAKMQVARNAVNDLAIELGSTLLPALARVAEGATGFFEMFAGLPEPIQAAVTILGTLAGVIGVVGGAALIAVPKVVALKVALETLGVSAERSAVMMSRLGTVVKGGIIAAALVGVAAAAMEVAGAFGEAIPKGRALTDSLDKFVRTGKVTGEAARLLGEDFEEFAEKFERSQRNAVAAALDPFGGTDPGTMKRLREEMQALDEALSHMVTSGNGEAAAAVFGEMTRRVEESGGSTEKLNEVFVKYGDALATVTRNTDPAVEGMSRIANATGGAIPVVQELSAAQQELHGILESFSDPIGTYQALVQEMAERTAERTADASDSWQDYAGSVDVSLDELARRLEEDNQAHRDWQANLVEIAGRAGTDVAQILAGMGEEGVRLTHQMANGTDAEMQRMATALREQARLGGQGAAVELDAAMRIMSAHAQSGGRVTVQQMAAELSLGVATVRDIANRYGIELAEGVNPILRALGAPPAVLDRGLAGGGSRSGGTTRFAEGGVEDHTAQIAPAGAWRVWAEPETGGEAYIPLSPAKRQRSVRIWQETGRRLGQFATGGFYTPEDVPEPFSTDPFRPPISQGGDAAMRRGYDATRAWVLANMEPPGGGSAAGLLPIMAAARRYVMDTWGIRNIGGFSRRNIAGTRVLSDHALGKAIDIMTTNRPVGWEIANFFAFGEGRNRFRAENVIWQQSISSRGGAFRRMADRGSPTQNHMDHVHVDTFAKGGILNPHVRDRGGPLEPGWTFNGTGRAEWVVPNADGRIMPAQPWLTLPSASPGVGPTVQVVHNGDNIAVDPQLYARQQERRMRDAMAVAGL